MRIISQDGNHSVQFERCHLWKQGADILTATEKGTVLLGRYETEGCAAQVFRDIHKSICVVDTFRMPSKGQVKII